MIASKQNTKANKFSRLLSLDVFRGITIALMILVNSPGNQTAYDWIVHSAWNGCTLADLVFPSFIFIVGVASVFSLSKAQEVNHLSSQQLFIKILKRSLIIFLIGLILNILPYFSFSSFRVYGVLQRIAICYFFGSLLFLTTRIETQALIMALLLVVYWLMMILIKVPGYGADNLTLQGNLVGYVDRLIFSPPHLYGKIFDPEGLLSTIPSIATALLGNLTGAWLISRYTLWQKLEGLVIGGLIALILGWYWGIWFPINKMMWTSSFVLWAGGWSLLALALCYCLIDIKGWKAWSKPFEIFGANALVVYFLHVFFLKVQSMIVLYSVDGSPKTTIKIWITETLFGWASPKNASLLYGLSYMLFWLLILTILYRKKIFIKI